MNDEPLALTIIKNTILTIGAIAVLLFWFVMLASLFF
jgi:hypothetical protein